MSEHSCINFFSDLSDSDLNKYFKLIRISTSGNSVFFRFAATYNNCEGHLTIHLDCTRMIIEEGSTLDIDFPKSAPIYNYPKLRPICERLLNNLPDCAFQ